MSSIRGCDFEVSFVPSDEPANIPLREVTSASDQALIHGLTSGGEAGFTAFYERFSSVLFCLVYRILRDRKEAEDALQEAFVQIWKQSSTFDPARAGLFSWTVRIARSRAIDRLRQRQACRRKTETAIAEAGGVEIAPAPDYSLMQREERMQVKAALALLSQHQREALELAFFSAMTHIEISNALRIPLGTVKARIRRGLITLREILRPRGEAVALQTESEYSQRSPSCVMRDADTTEIALC